MWLLPAGKLNIEVSAAQPERNWEAKPSIETLARAVRQWGAAASQLRSALSSAKPQCRGENTTRIAGSGAGSLGKLAPRNFAGGFNVPFVFQRLHSAELCLARTGADKPERAESGGPNQASGAGMLRLCSRDRRLTRPAELGLGLGVRHGGKTWVCFARTDERR